MRRLALALALLVSPAAALVAPLGVAPAPLASRAPRPAALGGRAAVAAPAHGRRAAAAAMQEGEGGVSDGAGIAYAGAIFAAIFASAGLTATGSPPNGLALACVALVGFTVAAKVLVPDKE